MLLSEADIKHLENAGFSPEYFVVCGKDGFVKLRNLRGHCVFYDSKKRRCKLYKLRPLGCRLYPVIFNEEEGIVVDDLCPMRGTITKSELKHKGKEVIRLLQLIDREAEIRKTRT
jgi:Fe-S-cluster containining protein